MLDALEMEQSYLKQTLNPKICVEIGSGSGCVLTFLANMLGSSRYYLSTDVNINACSATKKTATANGVTVETVRCDLVSPLFSRLKGKVDLLVFNPPYVPTDDEEVGSDNIEAAWAGGTDGRLVTDRLFPILSELMSDGGTFYLLVVLENKPRQIMKIMESYNFTVGGAIIKRQARNEHQQILKFVKNSNKL
eukprot:TRINITY_DN2923_c0_g1_i1.p1 TRINITY_DN2923_c0_g1~~TRINITY_DN2923_c0_g1_i1.p1  ORF type:complete len:192 (-),score=14.24 TRINITY_DN2923_c0_g1_i1:809-1384(-)